MQRNGLLRSTHPPAQLQDEPIGVGTFDDQPLLVPNGLQRLESNRQLPQLSSWHVIHGAQELKGTAGRESQEVSSKNNQHHSFHVQQDHGKTPPSIPVSEKPTQTQSARNDQSQGGKCTNRPKGIQRGRGELSSRVPPVDHP